FFRGSLSKNPLYSTDIMPSAPVAAGSGGSGGGAAGSAAAANAGGGSSPSTISGVAEATMRNLRDKIATDLDMADAADLLELIVCGNIVGLDIPVRVVQHELWRPHILETTADDYSSDCEAESLPAMMVTYRLAGVDGEATEEVVDSLADSDSAADQDPEVKFGIARDIAEEGGLSLLLTLAKPPAGPSAAEEEEVEASPEGVAASGSGDWEVFALAVKLLRRSCMLSANRSDLLSLKAPGILLHHLLEVLQRGAAG
ncbi:unnamed protein product, partial [Ectocarpus sp. 12 AP-2014]